MIDNHANKKVKNPAAADINKLTARELLSGPGAGAVLTSGATVTTTGDGLDKGAGDGAVDTGTAGEGDGKGGEGVGTGIGLGIGTGNGTGVIGTGVAGTGIWTPDPVEGADGVSSGNSTKIGFSQVLSYGGIKMMVPG